MVNKLKLFFVLIGIFCCSACAIRKELPPMGLFTTEFQPPVGLFFTSVKAPLTLDAPKKPLGEPKKETYLTNFLWIPLAVPSVSVTGNDQNDPVNNYSDYEYNSYVFGMFQSVSIITYK
ncbi:MAG: hypothetical protein MJ250_07000 [Alphaproteobacteria bacterium]|nr:hypothetical protein [Alphaproteobacteria bacterium]